MYGRRFREAPSIKTIYYKVTMIVYKSEERRFIKGEQMACRRKQDIQMCAEFLTSSITVEYGG